MLELAQRLEENKPLDRQRGTVALLRRITHYNFWSDALHRLILVDAKTDVFGMAEHEEPSQSMMCHGHT
jgi:hypothetical protein